MRALEIGDVEEDCWSRCNRARPVGQVRGGGKGEQVEFFLMSQKKRLSSTSSGGSGGVSPNMTSVTKKPKQQQQTSLLDHHQYNEKAELIMAADSEASPDSLMLLESLDEHLASTGPASVMSLSSSGTGVGTTANLSRKKATPPQPAKKLVIKPFKGELPLCLSVMMSVPELGLGGRNPQGWNWEIVNHFSDVVLGFSCGMEQRSSNIIIWASVSSSS